jgi:hypothetical protein
MQSRSTRGSGARWRRRLLRCGVTMVAVFSLVSATAALAASPKPGATYMGSETTCGTAPTGLSCTFVFRVSRNGLTMRFVSQKDVVGEWACHGGGGEAVFGTNKSPVGPGAPVPLLRIHANGTFRGSSRYGPSGHRGTVVATGEFTGSGKVARVNFTLNPGPKSCVNGPLKLTAH